MIKIIFEEYSDRLIIDKNIKQIAAGLGYVKYEGVFKEEEFVEFMNFLLKRTYPDNVSILRVSYE